MAEDIVETLKKVSEAFNLLDIPYTIGGSVASSKYGETRSTNDIDVIADIQLKDAHKLINALGPDWYADAESILRDIGAGEPFTLIDFGTMFKVDVFVASEDTFKHQQISRRVVVNFGTVDEPTLSYLVSLEDIVLQKILWYRMGNEVSNRQWRDVMSLLLFQQNNFDERYMTDWAEILGITDLLVKAKHQAGAELP